MNKLALLIIVMFVTMAGCSSSSAFDAKELSRKAQKNLNQMTPQNASICKDVASLYGSQIFDHYKRGASKTELLDGYKEASLSYEVSKGIIDFIYDAKTAGGLPNNSQEASVLSVYICTMKLK